MPHRILTVATTSIAELMRDPMGTVAVGQGSPVAALNDEERTCYCVPAKAYEALMDRLDDLALTAIADARLREGQTPLTKLEDL
jgi:antitoxin StbD